MPYMLLVIEPLGQRAERGEAAGREVYAQMLAFAGELQSQGLLLSANSLAPVTQAVRLRVRDGKTHTVDGPYAEAKEMVGGYFLLDVDTREAAVAIAERCPAAGWADIEVRPVAPCHVLD